MVTIYFREAVMKKVVVAVCALLVMLSFAVTGAIAQEESWETVNVRFSPRSLNLGSNGRWVSCTISGLPEGYLPADIDMGTLCIVEVNGMVLEGDGGPICSKDSGAKYNNRGASKLKIKFDRKDLADAITEYSDESPDNATITVEGYGLDGILQFYGDDTIKVKPAKIKK
jgi:hypothetical protein